MAVKKKTAKKKVAKKTVAKKKTAAPATPKITAIAKKQTKSQVVTALAESTGLTKKDIASVFEELGTLITRHMKRRGSGEFTIPDTGVKMRRVKKPARKARMGHNPKTGEAMKIAAKPAANTVRLTALKALKDTINA